jgi:hypothetical protein
MGCGPKGVKLGGCESASMIGGGVGKGGLKHEPKTWHVSEGQVSGVPT